MPVPEPAGMMLWDDLKAEGVQWPQTNEDMLAAMSSSWRSAADGFDEIGTRRHDVTAAWSDEAGVAMTGKMGEVSGETRLAGTDMRAMVDYLNEAADATAQAKNEINFIVSHYNSAYTAAMMMRPRTSILPVILIIVAVADLLLRLSPFYTIETTGLQPHASPAPIILGILVGIAIRAAARKAILKAVAGAATRAAKRPEVRRTKANSQGTPKIQAGSVFRNLPKSIRDASRQVPEQWGKGRPNQAWKNDPSKAGWRWTDPKNQGNSIRIDKGDPKSKFPSQRVDHVVVNRNGRIIDRYGNPIEAPKPSKTEDAHIPLEVWRNWTSWNHP